ncbi:hypothetical protein MMC25_001288 [Agyrium rufum]|nr:hypothetical protein [Agyrium rufum]
MAFTQTIRSLPARIAEELGVNSILSSPRDAKILCAQRFTRLFAYGASTLILVLYLSSLGISDTRIGLFMTLTLLGDVVISFMLTLIADGIGRRNILVGGASLMTASGIVFTVSGNYWVLVLASIIGVISPSGNEIGPFRAIEESTLAQLTPTANRSEVFAWYTLFGTAGAALGSILTGWTVEVLRKRDGWTEVSAYRVIFGMYACLGLVKLGLALMLSPNCEVEAPKQSQTETAELDAFEAEGLLSDSEGDDDSDENDDANGKTTSKSQKPSKSRRTPLTTNPSQSTSNETQNKDKRKSIFPSISPSSRSIVLKLSLLFAIDSGASGLVPSSWITYYFVQKFALPESSLGTLFFSTNIVSSASNLLASSLAKRIGLIQTMVFTHLPSSIMLALVPAPNVVWLAMTILILRSSTSSMDQAPRQAFLAAAVLPSERTAVMGVVNVVKTLAQSLGPVVTGYAASVDHFWVVFVLAGVMKSGYDLTMLKMFLGFKGREEGGQDPERRRRGDEDDAS